MCSGARWVGFCCALFIWTLPAYGFDLVLDPGHSPESPGAVSCDGTPEYRYNNALVAYIAASMAYLTDVRVTRTKGINDEISLKERVRDTAGKDLFISVHHDSVQPRFLNGQGRNGGRCSHKASGFSLFVSRKNPFFKESLAAATILGQSLLDQGLRPTLHHAEPIAGENRPLLDGKLGIYAYDELTVLKEARSPAVLLEAGVIVNPVDEKNIRRGEFKEIVARAIKAVAGSTMALSGANGYSCGHEKRGKPP